MLSGPTTTYLEVVARNASIFSLNLLDDNKKEKKYKEKEEGEKEERKKGIN